VTRRQRRDAIAVDIKKRVRRKHQHGAGLLRQVGKSGVDLAVGGGAKDFNMDAKGRRRGLQIPDKAFSQCRAGIDQREIMRGLRHQFAKQAEPLARKFGVYRSDAGEVAAWTIDALDEAECNRVGADGEDDRNGGGRTGTADFVSTKIAASLRFTRSAAIAGNCSS
jgi:hypothetical protein